MFLWRSFLLNLVGMKRERNATLSLSPETDPNSILLSFSFSLAGEGIPRPKTMSLDAVLRSGISFPLTFLRWPWLRLKGFNESFPRATQWSIVTYTVICFCMVSLSSSKERCELLHTVSQVTGADPESTRIQDFCSGGEMGSPMSTFLPPTTPHFLAFWNQGPHGFKPHLRIRGLSVWGSSRLPPKVPAMKWSGRRPILTLTQSELGARVWVSVSVSIVFQRQWGRVRPLGETVWNPDTCLEGPQGLRLNEVTTSTRAVLPSVQPRYTAQLWKPGNPSLTAIPSNAIMACYCPIYLSEKPYLATLHFAI